MIRSISIFVMILLDAALFAQAPDTMWTKTYGGSGSDVGYSVQQTTDGGYIIVGSTESFGAGGDDVWLIKTDSAGDILWSKTYGDSLDDGGRSVQQTTDGGYIITGHTDSFADGRDVWLIKTDANGDTLWTKTFGGSGSDNGNSVDTTIDGGYIITGSTSSLGAGSSDVWLIKTDADGNSLWTETFGGSSWDFGFCVQKTLDEGYIITGLTHSFGAGGDNVWLIKTDVNGDTLWTKTFGDSFLDSGTSVQQTLDGGYILTGNTNGMHRYYYGYAWLIRTNANGDTIWTKTFGEGGSPYASNKGNSVQQTNDGGYIIAGEGIPLIKTDPNGDTLWTSYIVGFSFRNNIQQTSDGGYITTGMGSGAGGDLWLIKIAPDVTSIDENPHALTNGYQLKQNYPNPFNPTTNIEFSIPKSEFVTLKIYNILGEEVGTLVSEKLAAGSYKYDWDAGSLASGVYLCRMKVGDQVQIRKMILMK